MPIDIVLQKTCLNVFGMYQICVIFILKIEKNPNKFANFQTQRKGNIFIIILYTVNMQNIGQRLFSYNNRMKNTLPASFFAVIR